MSLKDLKPTKVNISLSGKFIHIYGPPKIGKTTTAAQFPKTLLLAGERGYNALANIYVKDIFQWTDIRKAVKELVSDEELKSMFETIAIDTADIMWALVEKWVCSNHGVDSISEIPWGKGYKECESEFFNIFNRLAMAGYGIVFISHEQEKTVKETVSKDGKIVDVDVVKICPSLADRPRKVVNKLVDILAYIKLIRKEDGTAERILITRDNGHFEAGSRFKYLPPTIPLEYNALLTAVVNAIKKQTEESQGTIVEAPVGKENVENEKYHKELLDKIKTAWGTLGDEKKEEIVNFVIKKMRRPMKISEIPVENIDVLEEILQLVS